MGQQHASYNPDYGQHSIPTISAERNREMFAADDVRDIILDHLKSEGIMPPEGTFLDIGTGHGLVPIELARALSKTHPNSQFIGIDLFEIDREIPDDLREKVKFESGIDGFERLASIESDSVSLVTFINILERIQAESRTLIGENRIANGNNLEYLGVQLFRILKEGGVVYILGGLSKSEQDLLFKYARNSEFKLIALPDYDNKNRFFRKVRFAEC